MILLLDTNIVVELAKEREDIISRIQELMEGLPSKLHISSPTYSETYYGCLNKGKQAREAILQYLDSFELMNTSRESSIIFAQLRDHFQKTGKNIPPMDLLIASIVMANGATLVSKDKHFKQIGGLDLILL